MNYSRVAIAGLLAIALSPRVATADPAKNIQVAGRLLTFLKNAPAGRTVVGVVFDPAQAGSVAEMNAIMAATGGGYTVGAVTIVGKPVAASAVGSAQILFITRGVNYSAFGSVARARHVITIGSDLACVREGVCVVGISTDPTVQIIVNRKAAAAVGVSFRAAFRMMIQEI